jgi:hypothetical protein
MNRPPLPFLHPIPPSPPPPPPPPAGPWPTASPSSCYITSDTSSLTDHRPPPPPVPLPPSIFFPHHFSPSPLVSAMHNAWQPLREVCTVWSTVQFVLATCLAGYFAPFRGNFRIRYRFSLCVIRFGILVVLKLHLKVVADYYLKSFSCIVNL